MCCPGSPASRRPTGSRPARGNVPLIVKEAVRCCYIDNNKKKNQQQQQEHSKSVAIANSVVVVLIIVVAVQYVVTGTTAPRARALAAACLCLAALCVAARCYANSPATAPSRPKRSLPLAGQEHHHQVQIESNSNATDTQTQTETELLRYEHTNNHTTLKVNSASASVRLQHTSRPMSMPNEPALLHEHRHNQHPHNTVKGGSSSQPSLVDRGGGGGAGGGEGGGGGGGGGLVALVVGATLLTATLGLITCVVSHYRGGGGGGGSAGGAPPPPPPPPQPPHTHTTTTTLCHHPPHQQHTAPMLSVMSASAAAGVGMGEGGRLHRHHVGHARELAAQRDRQVRLHSVHTDLELDLPPSIALPDGEELPYGSSARLHIRDPEQESEIYQKCIRPPPNRTVFESESPPPYRSSSAGLLGSLGSSSSGHSDWSAGSTPLVVRCHSMSSSKCPTSAPATSTASASASASQKTDFLQRTVKILTGRKSNSSSGNSQAQPAPAPTLPAVVVPARPRRI